MIEGLLNLEEPTLAHTLKRITIIATWCVVHHGQRILITITFCVFVHLHLIVNCWCSKNIEWTLAARYFMYSNFNMIEVILVRNHVLSF